MCRDSPLFGLDKQELAKHCDNVECRSLRGRRPSGYCQQPVFDKVGDERLSTIIPPRAARFFPQLSREKLETHAAKSRSESRKFPRRDGNKASSVRLQYTHSARCYWASVWSLKRLVRSFKGLRLAALCLLRSYDKPSPGASNSLRKNWYLHKHFYHNILM